MVVVKDVWEPCRGNEDKVIWCAVMTLERSNNGQEVLRKLE